MCSRPPGWLAAGLLALSLACTGSALAGDPQPTVLVLSWDGLRHDQPELGDFPALARLAREGLRAERLVPPFPSNTFPGHVTLATGTYPDRHGIVGNRFLDPERGLYDYSNDASWIQAEPLWVAAERQGVRAAVFFWVGSETDWHGRGPSFRKAPFDSRVSDAEKVEQLLAWLDLPEPQRPHLLLAWWHGTDHAGHQRGPDAPEVRERLAEQDAQLGRLLAGLDARDLWPHTTLLLVSDHGMAAAGQAIDAAAALEAAGVEARVLSGGGMAHVYLEAGEPTEAAQRLRAALPGIAVYTRDELPARLRARHPRSGDVVLLARPPATFTAGGWLAALRRSSIAGMHGYDPELPDMGGVFLALGRGVPRGARLGPVRAVDVAPSVAALLGIEPPQHSEGQARLPLEGGT